MFKKGRTSVTDSERSGCLSTATSNDKQEQARAMILMGRRITVRDTASTLDISEGSAHSFLDSTKFVHSGFRRNSQEHKHNHVDISSHLLERYCNEGDKFLNHIITGDETWIHHYEPQSKGQSMQRKHPSSPAAKKFKTQPSAGKLMLTVFWDSQGPILEHYQECGTTVTSARYSNTLQNELRPATCTK
jgi:histone-lysine N-methyltransferase SETMAR